MKIENIFPAPKIWSEIAAILRRGNSAELKLVRGEIQILELRRTIKYKVTPPTGEADG